MEERKTGLSATREFYPHSGTASETASFQDNLKAIWSPMDLIAYTPAFLK
jgi:hypothetical protein